AAPAYLISSSSIGRNEMPGRLRVRLRRGREAEADFGESEGGVAGDIDLDLELVALAGDAELFPDEPAREGSGITRSVAVVESATVDRPVADCGSVNGHTLIPDRRARV